SIADNRSTVGGTAAAAGLPANSNPYSPGSGSYTPAANSYYSQPATSTSPPANSTSPYPAAGAAPSGGSDSGEAPYKPGSLRNTSEFSPRSINSLSPASLGSSSGSSGVVPASYSQTPDARY